MVGAMDERVTEKGFQGIGELAREVLANVARRIEERLQNSPANNLSDVAGEKEAWVRDGEEQNIKRTQANCAWVKGRKPQARGQLVAANDNEGACRRGEGGRDGRLTRSRRENGARLEGDYSAHVANHPRVRTRIVASLRAAPR